MSTQVEAQVLEPVPEECRACQAQVQELELEQEPVECQACQELEVLVVHDLGQFK